MFNVHVFLALCVFLPHTVSLVPLSGSVVVDADHFFGQEEDSLLCSE